MNIQTVNFGGLSFINVPKPTEFEMKHLQNTYGFNPLRLEDYLHRTQIPKIESSTKYDLVVLRLPLFTEHNGGLQLPRLQGGIKKRRIVSSYVDFFVAKEYLVILHEAELPQINHIFSLCQKTLHDRNEYMGQGAAFLMYKIIDALVDACLQVINELSATIDKIDKELEHKQTQTTLEEISTTRRNIVVLHTMIKPILPLFKQLEEGKYKQLNGSMQLFWGNILDHLQKIWDRLEDSRELIEGISESNESLLSSRTNEIIKVLTIFSAVILPLTLVASIYGMNVNLPLSNDPLVFWKIISLMLAGSIIMLLVLKIKRWF